MHREEQKVENVESDKQTDGLRPIWKVLVLLLAVFYALIFFKIILTGYLSRIGLVVGTVITSLILVSLVLTAIGGKHLNQRINRIFVGIVFLVVVIILVVLSWPEGNHTWSPYRFDDKLASMEAKRAVPDQDNAAIRYQSLFAAIDINDYPGSFLRKDGHIRDEFKAPWKGSDYPEVSQWLDSHTDTLEELQTIGNMEKCRWPIQVKVCDEYTVPYKPLPYCWSLLIAASNRDLGENKLQKAIEKSLCLLRMAEHLYQQTHLLDLHNGFDHEEAALEIIRGVLVESELSQKDIDEIADHLPTTTNTWQKDLLRLLEFEKFRFVNLMTSMYEINEKGRIRFSETSGTLSLEEYTQERSKRTDRLRRLYRLINMPLDPNGVWDMAESEAVRFSRFLEQDPTPDINKVTDEWLFSNITDMIINPPRWAIKGICFNKVTYVSFKQFYLSNITQRRGTQLVLGLRKYRDTHGTWPVSIENISEYVQSEAFIDLINGDTFVFATEGDSFRLYSKGPNGIDEGGRFGYNPELKKAADDISIWPPQKQ